MVVAFTVSNPACAPERAAPPPEQATLQSKEPPSFVDARSVFANLEQTLLEAKTLHLVGRVQATGVLSATLEGGIWLQGRKRARVDFAGSFASQPVYLLLTSDGRRMRGGNDGSDFELSTPEELREGIVLGLTRMGILHNLAMLTSGVPPEHTDGTFDDWVRVTDLELGGEAEIDGERSRAVSFVIVVDGTPSSSATLWLSVETGLPVQRNQRVTFPQGEMTVVEKYDVFDLDVAVDSRRFQPKRR